MSRRRTSFNRKVDNIIRKGKELRVLADKTSTQEERILALESLEARKRQQPDHSFSANNLPPAYGVSNYVDPNRPSIEDEMLQQKDSAHGHPTFAPGYQEFSDHEVYTHPKVLPRWNISNYDYADERIRRAKRMIQSQKPSQVVKQNLTQTQRRFTESVVHALKRQSDLQRTKLELVYERFERTNKDASQEQLFVIAADLGVLKEEYKSTAGEWVVVMPFSEPKSVEELLYNQRGMSGKNHQQLKQDQTRTYWQNADKAYQDVYYPQVPPAKPVPGSEETKYYAGQNTKSQQSLRNPKRGDDFIRNSRVTAAMQEDPRRTGRRGVQENVSTGAARRASAGGIQQRTSAAEAQRVRDAAKPRTPQPGDRDYKITPPYKPVGDRRNAAGQRIGGLSDDKARELRARLRKEEMEMLLDLAEKTTNQETKRRYLGKVKELQNLQVSEDAAFRARADYAGLERAKKSAIHQSAQAVTRMENPTKMDEQMRNQLAYQRHLSLLHEAEQMLSKGGSKFFHL